MRYSPIHLVSILLLLPISAYTQQQVVRIVIRPEAEQRRFVKEYLDQGLPLGRREVIGIPMEPIVELGVLARIQPWVVPILEQRMKDLFMEGAESDDQIKRIAGAIAGSASQQGLDALTRLSGQHPDGSKWIRKFIYSSLHHPNYVKLWYSALDSPNQMVRETAITNIPNVTDIAMNPGLRDWADAALDRYHHVPTEEEILNDPIYGLSRSRNLKVEEIQRLRTVVADEVERRRKGGKPGHPVR